MAKLTRGQNRMLVITGCVCALSLTFGATDAMVSAIDNNYKQAIQVHKLNYTLNNLESALSSAAEFSSPVFLYTCTEQDNWYVVQETVLQPGFAPSSVTDGTQLFSSFATCQVQADKDYKAAN